MAFIIFLVFSLMLQAVHGELVCEELPTVLCSFAISSSGKRCLLETPAFSDHRNPGLQCITSDVLVNSLSEHIERDECINACGVDRNVVGISSDSLLETEFVVKLCSPACYDNCPSIVDLHFNLALAEGAFLPAVCEAQKEGSSRRQMTQLLSSGTGTANSATTPAAPSPSPAPPSSRVGADGPSAATPMPSPIVKIL